MLHKGQNRDTFLADFHKKQLANNTSFVIFSFFSNIVLVLNTSVIFFTTENRDYTEKDFFLKKTTLSSLFYYL